MDHALIRRGRPVPSVFDLPGQDEANLAAALAWALHHAPTLRQRLWERLQLPGYPDQATIGLEPTGPESTGQDGRTHIEIAIDGDIVAIIEATRGWLLPGETDLDRYIPRFHGATNPLLLVVSESSDHWATTELPTHVGAVPVQHLPWTAIQDEATAAFDSTRIPAQRLWLNELVTYLQGATSVRTYDDQWVYIVSVSHNRLGNRTYRDYVRTERVYFHPFGKNWPRTPPTLIGFRWDGALQQVNRITDTSILTDLRDRWPDIPHSSTLQDAGPHAVYELGPNLQVPQLPAGRIFRDRRVTALLDQLLTQPTIEDAVTASDELRNHGNTSGPLIS